MAMSRPSLTWLLPPVSRLRRDAPQEYSVRGVCVYSSTQDFAIDQNSLRANGRARKSLTPSPRKSALGTPPTPDDGLHQGDRGVGKYHQVRQSYYGRPAAP